MILVLHYRISNIYDTSVFVQVSKDDKLNNVWKFCEAFGNYTETPKIKKLG